MKLIPLLMSFLKELAISTNDITLAATLIKRRVLNREIKVDKRTLKAFFRAFDLQLETGDYTIPGADVSKSPVDAAPTSQHTADLQFPVEEVMQLQQRLLNDYRRLLELLGSDANESSRSFVNG